jgi:predicted AlkP superfamily phosphohydrolase/phosphomutase
MDLIVLGVDGVDPEYLEEALEKRDMPNWEKLKLDSFYSELPSTVPSITVPAWQCMFSGYNPGRFDTYHMNVFDFGDMSQGIAKSSNFRGGFFWDKTEEVTASLHYVPGTSPVYSINGYMRNGFPGPGAHFFPDELGSEVMEKISEPDSYEDERKVAELMMEKKSDVYISVITMTDRKSHHAKTRADVLDAYSKTDVFLGKVLEKAERENANLLVVSDHGFMHSERKFNALNFLEEKGLMNFSEGERDNSTLYRMAQPFLKTPLRVPLKKMHEIYHDFTGEKINDTEENILDAIEPGSKVLPSWKPVGRELGLKINTEDMPHGEVSEEEKEEILQDLEEELETLEDSGRKVVEEIWRGNELYDESENMPDLVFRTTEDFIPDVLTSDMRFVNTSSFTHDINGVFFAKGPEIDQNPEEDLEIFDVAPLIYALLGEDIPDDLDAELPEKLLDGVDVGYVSDELKGLDF